MDAFGIGAAVRSAAAIYFRSARATGRTTAMLESLKDGDRIVFIDSREAERVRRLLEGARLKVECIVVPPAEPHRLFERGTSQGRTLFDHSWVEQYYINALDRCELEIGHFQKQLSGWGQPHIETRMKAAEMARWVP